MEIIMIAMLLMSIVGVSLIILVFILQFNNDISLQKKERDYLLTLKAKKVDRSKLSFANNNKEYQEDFTKEEIEKMEEDFKNKIDNYNSSTDFNYVFDNNEVISISKKGVNNE